METCTGVMGGGGNLIEQAAVGSVEAQSGLIDLAMRAGACGAIRQVEALMSAEIWARLAASTGAPSEIRQLAGVLIARSNFETERGIPYNAQWYDAESQRLLRPLAEAGDVEAAAMLAELDGGPIPPPILREDDPASLTFNMTLAAAARGNLVALSSLYDEAYRSLGDGKCDPIEGLTAAELYARLGAASGDNGQIRRLAGVLLKRAEYEIDAGWPAIADSAITEATVLLSILVDTGDASMTAYLQHLVSGRLQPAVAVAIVHRPTILNFIQCEGTC